ncbi:SIR2 family protein [Bacteroides fragilis]|nr:SIR2 family protein [Bacteroides fragilis]
MFSEEAYHKVYSEPYHWSNLVQLATLRENNCLMIGLSLSDPNLRRLLEIAAQKHSKNNRHYVFMQRLSNDNLIDEGNKERIDIISANKIIQTHHVVQEMMMSSLGTNIIWFEDYDEIPKLLDSIKK